MKSLPALFTSACAALLFSVVAPPAQAVPAVGAPAPGFTLTDSDGQSHSLADYKGKYVVLEWTNPGCPFVKKHYDSGNMPRLQAEEVKKGVIWLSIDSSAPGKEGYLSGADARQAKAGEYASNTALLIDGDGKVGHLYGATNTPHMYVVDPDGKLIYTGAIDSIASADQADIAKATNYVREALDDAMSSKPVAKPTSKAYGCSIKYNS